MSPHIRYFTIPFGIYQDHVYVRVIYPGSEISKVDGSKKMQSEAIIGITPFLLH
jgi:hypothetical protein